jgi:hypothetical protein
MDNLRKPTLLEFVHLRLFERTREGVLGEAEVKAVEDALLDDPEAGAVIGGTSGVRKIRAARAGGGKRGGARVAYLFVPHQQTIYFILAFPKNVQGNLTQEQKEQVRGLVNEIRSDRWPRGGWARNRKGAV